MKTDMSPGAVTCRLREVSALAWDLRPETRLDTKIDLGPAAITARLREVADLLNLSRRLAASRPSDV